MLIIWLLLATGFTGALTLMFWLGTFRRWLFPPPSVAAHFSPKGGCTEVVVGEINRASREILVLAYSFSSKPITEALAAARSRGLSLQVVLDRSNEQDNYSTLPFLQAKGIATVIDSHHAIAHNKVMLIDGHIIITGSFNFTHQAEVENAENLLVIKNNHELARVYRQNFESHKAHSQPPGARAATAAAHPPHHRAA